MPYVNKRKQWNGKWVNSKARVAMSGAVTGSSVKQTYGKKKRRFQNSSKLSDKKINTLVEQRMVEIAKEEVEKNLKVLTSRKYLFHTYNPLTNEFQVLANRSDLIDWKGRVVEVSNIPKTDVQTTLNQPQIDDPDTAQDENADGDGPNQLMLGQTIHGERWGEIIYIKSLSANVRLRSILLEDTDIDLFGTVKIKYAFVMWRDDEATMDLVGVEPESQQLLRMNPFGYKGALDKSLEMDFNGLNTRILCQGECMLNLNESQTTERFTTIYKKFDKPLQIIYNERSQNGQVCNKKIYFVCRSTVPSPLSYADIKPSVYVCTKINYYEQ